MNEGTSVMASNAFVETRRICVDEISGLPGIAVRLGRALENWGREVSRPVDREAQRREFERHIGNEARVLQAERLVRLHR